MCEAVLAAKFQMLSAIPSARSACSDVHATCKSTTLCHYTAMHLCAMPPLRLYFIIVVFGWH